MTIQAIDPTDHVAIGGKLLCPVRLEVLWAIRERAQEIIDHRNAPGSVASNAICIRDAINNAVKDASGCQPDNKIKLLAVALEKAIKIIRGVRESLDDEAIDEILLLVRQTNGQDHRPHHPGQS